MLSSSTLDRYIAGQSPVHLLDARVKLSLTLAYILALALLPSGAWLVMGLCAAMLWVAVRWSQVGLRTILLRAFVALPFALVAVTLVFSVPGQPVFRLPLGPWVLTASDAGLVRFASIVFKSWLSVQAALLLTATTHFTQVLYALRALRLPTVLVAILSFAYRYLFVMIDEAQRMLRARECRSAETPGQHSGGSIVWRARVVGQMVGTLFVRSYERSERIYLAMLARGFTGELRTLNPRSLTQREQGILIIGLATLAGLVLMTYLA
ncbi:cobalt ABC transporter, inner membrane subunit CbiQ [Oscillochloris trichoides DG-6]|uniref:Cobalt ABC transporter, inner membrane subunit CbiQ n=1 Tax=Oscillochloris trichoides DG-6 TaxID=765420 RepID=E1IEE7_9CHLR|nr:cobalt ECF transporter T component CbiQ [Oscillochloris trichoides]EFO80473.1 cobalt ABC transporter, inner membrane subunit CbiQ [Oscillochloris trichoides DG-6]